VNERLAVLVGAERDRWAALDADLAGPFDEINRMVQAGGKRLRPAFCHWGFVGAGGNAEDQRVVDVGAAFELMHAFALFHDDVMDDAATRRGAPTTHAVYAREHRASGWTGESRRFGEGAAILIGDLAFVLSGPCGASAGSRRPSASPATRAASTRSSGRCTSERSSRHPTAPTRCCPS
jgi:geranylgeranyl diphosphate synthase type I